MEPPHLAGAQIVYSAALESAAALQLILRARHAAYHPTHPVRPAAYHAAHAARAARAAYAAHAARAANAATSAAAYGGGGALAAAKLPAQLLQRGHLGPDIYNRYI